MNRKTIVVIRRKPNVRVRVAKINVQSSARTSRVAPLVIVETTHAKTLKLIAIPACVDVEFEKIFKKLK